MRNKIFFFILIIFFIYPCFAKNGYEKKIGILDNNKETPFNFITCDFYAKCGNDYKTVNIKYQSKSMTKDFTLICDSYVELLSILNVDNKVFWFCCESLGFEQYFILDIESEVIYEPFFDMKNSVKISRIDYDNQILFGDTCNTDKGIMPTQKVELYLFSTSKQEHYKIAEKYGEGFSITIDDNYKIQYTDSEGKQAVFDYSTWIKQKYTYTVSSFLIEGKTIYGSENLSSKDGLPWASANGFGIKDTIRITIPSCEGLKLALYNGFQSESRPDLYKANSRVKKIKIRNIMTGDFKEFLLKDIQSVQIMSLEDLCSNNNNSITIEITILEVYPGEKYKDLCIQAIIPEY